MFHVCICLGIHQICKTPPVAEYVDGCIRQEAFDSFQEIYEPLSVERRFTPSKAEFPSTDRQHRYEPFNVVHYPVIINLSRRLRTHQAVVVAPFSQEKGIVVGIDSEKHAVKAICWRQADDVAIPEEIGCVRQQSFTCSGRQLLKGGCMLFGRRE